MFHKMLPSGNICCKFDIINPVFLKWFHSMIDTGSYVYTN